MTVLSSQQLYKIAMNEQDMFNFIFDREFCNYHKHSHWSNLFVADSLAKESDYINRAIQLGHSTIFTTEHGMSIGWFSYYNLVNLTNSLADKLKTCYKYDRTEKPIISDCEKNNINFDILSESVRRNRYKTLKFRFAVEGYFAVSDDKPNLFHIMLIAKNRNGMIQINRELSRCSIDSLNEEVEIKSFRNKRPKLSLERLLQLNPNDVVITTACVGGYIVKHEEYDLITQVLYKHFQDSFYLEVQYNNTDLQKKLNQRCLELSKKYGIELISGLDSHMIFKEEETDRDAYQYTKSIHYDDEEDWEMDYVDYQTCVSRYKKQGVLSNFEILKSIENTRLMLDYDEIEIDTTSRKIPVLPEYLGKTIEEKNEIFKNLLWTNFEKMYPNIHKDNVKLNIYRENIQKEIDVITKGKVADYFLFNHKFMKTSVERGGILTQSGRGSGVSYLTNHLLGFTSVDRIASKITMFPERFLTLDRIQGGSLPDIDHNLYGRQIFIDTQRELLGKDNSYFMMAVTRLKAKSAFKIYAKSQGVPFDVANEITKQLTKYETDLKYINDDDIPEEDRIELNVYDYIDEKYYDIYNESKKFIGTIDSVSQHPCFVGDTLVMTECGYKKIKNIVVGDKVMTHTNKFQKVNKIMSRESKSVLKIKASGLEDLTTTENHPFYIKRVGIRNTKNRNIEPTWVDAINLKVGDYVSYPINQESIIPVWKGVETGRYGKIKNTLQMNNSNFWWLIGRYIGDGWTYKAIKKDTGKPYSYRFFICCNKNNSELLDITKKMDALKMHYNINEERTCYKICVFDKEIYSFVQQFGHSASKKELTSTILNLPKNLLECFMDGYISADGHFLKEINSYTFTTVSKKLSLALQTVVHKLYNTACTITIRDAKMSTIEGRTVNCKKQYIMKYKKDIRKRDKTFSDGIHIWMPFKSLETIDEEHLVYNMSVDKDETYTVNNVVVHNCAFLITNEAISENIGVLRMKDTLVACIEGHVADSWGYVKNDLLSVAVYGIIGNCFKRIGKPIFSSDELLKKIDGDKKVWDLYAKGHTMCL